LTRDLVAVLEETVSFPAARIPEATNGVSTVRHAESAALAVRKVLRLTDAPVSNVIEMLEALGVVVVPINRGGRRVSAFSTWTGDRPFIFLNNHDENPRSRTRFDNSHELGHLVMHADTAPGDNGLEKQADRFASAFLLPKQPFLDECPSRLYWEHLIEIKRKWGVSLAAIVRRGYDLGRFSEATYRRAYVELNRRGWRRSEPAEDHLPSEQPELLARKMQAAELAGLGAPDLARELGVSVQDLDALISGADLSRAGEGAAA
jgi:Zn-dependent peptidase ImmA (M78 family)